MGKTKNRKKHKKRNGSEGDSTRGDDQQERLSKDISSECNLQQMDTAATSGSSTHLGDSDTSKDEVPRVIDREAVSKYQSKTASPASDDENSKEQTRASLKESTVRAEEMISQRLCSQRVAVRLPETS